MEHKYLGVIVKHPEDVIGRGRIAGIPGLSVPAGFVGNLPNGFQILGPQFSESLLFQIGHQYEQATNWYKIKPKL